MSTIRRYGPSLVAPQVAPRPELGQGREKAFATYQGALQGVQEFIRPAVEKVQTERGQREALEAVEETGPEWRLRQLPQTEQGITLGGGPGPSLPFGPTRARAAIQTAAERNGVDAGAMSVIAYLESRFDPNAQNPDSSAGGLFQFIDSTAADYGLQNRFDVDQSADAGARLLRDNTSALAEALGRQPSVGEMYLAHQQGAGGAIKLLSAPRGTLASAVVGREAVRLNGGDPDRMTAGEFANLWIDKANSVAQREGITVSVPNAPEFELEAINASTFEPRRPFTIRDAAFNRAADRVIASKASAALEQGITNAIQQADGDLEKLQIAIEQVQSEVIEGLGEDHPGLKVELEEQLSRARAVATRQVVDLAQRRVFRGQEDALQRVASTTQAQAERLALTGASSADIAAHMAQATSALAQFGPREEFTVNGQVFPADPSRAGMLTPADIATRMADVTLGARKIMLETDFARSDAQGAYVDEFRRQVFSGNSPFNAGESLQMLANMEAAARRAESARRVSAERERQRLEQEMGATINAYVEMTEAGVPVAIPQEERAAILSSLSPYPELQRKARIEFAVADAAVATHGMNGQELMGYVGRVREDMRAALERGELDLAGAAVIESLEDRVKQVQDAVTAETIGLPLVEQLAMNGARADDVNYDGLRERAAGKPDLVKAINEVEAFHRDAEALQGMSAAERDVVLTDARNALAVLAASGDQYGAQALMAQRVVDRLEEWSEHRADMAENDPIAFAAATGVELPSLQGAESMAEAGAIVAQRVELLAPQTMAEGVRHPVPLTQSEVDALSEVFRESPRASQSEFLATISGLGREQSEAIFKRIGQSEPVLFAAGMVYAGGNKEAAGVILRGAVDTKLAGGGPVEIAAARADVLDPLLRADIIEPEAVLQLDAMALAYARGLAMAEGGRDIEARDLRNGYNIALGRQDDGTGGYFKTSHGPAVLPGGVDGDMMDEAVRDAVGITRERFWHRSRDVVQDGAPEFYDEFGKAINPRDILYSIEGLVPASAAPREFTDLLSRTFPDVDLDRTYFPVNADGAYFMTGKGSGLGILHVEAPR